MRPVNQEREEVLAVVNGWCWLSIAIANDVAAIIEKTKKRSSVRVQKPR